MDIIISVLEIKLNLLETENFQMAITSVFMIINESSVPGRRCVSLLSKLKCIGVDINGKFEGFKLF